MENDFAKVVQPLPHSLAKIKVHQLMCTELVKYVDRTSQIFPDIESAQPRCTAGIQALCSASLAIEKAKSLIQHCAESSKLYLVITGEAILSRCEKVRNALELSLFQIQNMVPLVLAGQISGIVDDLRDAKFLVEPSEEEAGKVLLALLRQDPSTSDSIETFEFEAFQLAAVRLHLTSSKALLIEKRSIKNLLGKVLDTDHKKEKILKYLLYLLRKYGKLVQCEQKDGAIVQHEDSHTITKFACNDDVGGEAIEQEPYVQYGYEEAQVDASRTPIPPQEFRCPISLRLMHDPVVIASGQTFERVWIEKWFNEGHDTCPKTQEKLSHLSMTPNSAIKDLISKWSWMHGIPIPGRCSQSTPGALRSWETSSCSSIASFGSSLNDVPIQIDLSSISIDSWDASCGSDSAHVKIVDAPSVVPFRMNSDSLGCQSSANSNHWMRPGFLSKLAELPWESQCKAVEAVKNHLKEDDQACHSLFSDSSLQLLIRFMENAYSLSDVKALRDGAQVLLALVNKCSSEIPSLGEDVFHVLASFIDSEITDEVLSILEVLSVHQYCISKTLASGPILSILKILDTQIGDFHLSAVKILYNLSLNRDIGFDFQSLGCIMKLVPLLGDSSLAGYSIKIIKNLCNTVEGMIATAETNGCIASLVELLETGSHEEQEHGVAVLLSLCLLRTEYCLLALNEGIVPPLVDISVNGNARGKESARELLRLLRDIRCSDSLEHSPPDPGANLEFSLDSNSSKEKKPYEASKFLGRKWKPAILHNLFLDLLEMLHCLHTPANLAGKAMDLTMLERQRAQLKWQQQQHQQSQLSCQQPQQSYINETQFSAFSLHQQFQGLIENEPAAIRDPCLVNGWPDLGKCSIPRTVSGRETTMGFVSPSLSEFVTDPIEMGNSISRTASSLPSMEEEKGRESLLTASAAGRESSKKRKLDKVAVAEDTKDKRTKRDEEVESKITEQNNTIAATHNNSNRETSSDSTKENSKASEIQKPDYIHVRARRGQATDSHSLAERVRRERISERMKYLQDLVPGCNKITGKAGMLDEIINYVQSLQRQVEFLSMKLASVNPKLDFNMENSFIKEMLPACTASFPAVGMSSELANSGYLQFNNAVQQVVSCCGGLDMAINSPEMTMRRTTMNTPPVSTTLDSLLDSSCFNVQPTSAFTWVTDLQQGLYNVESYQGRSNLFPPQPFTGTVEAANILKMEM
ncbi:hypothetical protein NE237_016815 [Protea cynaroides]|uniref:RING-type E3 ubiquitin transferase n=1 Tax=Protea cynaroides TaxID=273540 RepID=A0A9Q0K6I0_9MAGN|nr:hypothetical protein NE237_016815 [Protea cynaroides]